MVVNSNFVIKHHATKRHHQFDPDDDDGGACPLRRGLNTKRPTCGVLCITGTTFRFDDRFTDHRLFKPDEVDQRKLSAKSRLHDGATRHPDIAAILREGWIGITTFTTKRSIVSKTTKPVTRETCDSHPKCPASFPKPGKANTGMKQARRDQRDRHFERMLQYDKRAPKAKTSTLIEICCEFDSQLCQEEHGGSHRRMVRIIADHGFTSARGLGKAINALEAEDAGHVTAWFAFLCAWGSQARDSNKT